MGQNHSVPTSRKIRRTSNEDVFIINSCKDCNNESQYNYLCINCNHRYQVRSQDDFHPNNRNISHDNNNDYFVHGLYVLNNPSNNHHPQEIMIDKGLRTSRSEEMLGARYFNPTRNPGLPPSPPPDSYDANHCYYNCHHHHPYELNQLAPSPSPSPPTNFIHNPPNIAISSNICKPHEYSPSTSPSNQRVLRSYVSCSSLKIDKPREYPSQIGSPNQHLHQDHHHSHHDSNIQQSKKEGKKRVRFIH